jgi:predicted thioredoxin/glutaredoxin
MPNAEQAIKDLKIVVEVVKVDDLDEIVERGVMLTPALFINGEVVAEGRVPDVDEIKNMIRCNRVQWKDFDLNWQRRQRTRIPIKRSQT